MSKIILGTVQFGLQYGVNSAGRPNQEDVKIILTEAAKGGITTLDTSSAYGNSEEILGVSIANHGQFKIVSKYPKGGKVQKIGFSLYNPEELEFILKNGSPFDLIQVPFNIFDKKFLPYMKELHERSVEIHVRSTFLQGLFFKDRNALPEKLQPLKKYLLQLDEFSKKTGLSISEIALNYNLQNPYIDGVLIGVDNVEQLQMNLNSVKETPVDIEFEIKEQELLNPVNWN